jgi:hypothetical protein
MNYLRDLIGMLGMRSRDVKSMSERRTLILSLLCFWLGFLAFNFARSQAYANLPEFIATSQDPFHYFVILFKGAVYALLFVATALAVSKTISGVGRSISKREFLAYASALMPLWGALFLMAVPLQIFLPEIHDAWRFDFSIPMLVLILLLAVYTTGTLRHLSGLSPAQTVIAFVVSSIGLPIYYIVFSLLFAMMHS